MTAVYLGAIQRVVSVGRSVVAQIRENNVSFMAGSVAYSAFVSILPLLVLLVIVISALGGEELADYVVGATQNYLTPTGQGILTDALTRAVGQTGLSLLGLIILLWGVLKVFRTLDTAFSEIYGTQGSTELLLQLRDGIVVLVAMSVAFVAVVAASAVFAFLPELRLLRALNPLLLVVGLSIAFLPLYYVFPDADVTVREVLPGAVFAAVGWAFLEALFGIYVSFSSTRELYGVLGAIILLITWFYFGAFLLLVGAVTNVVLAERIRPHSSEGQ